MGTISLYEPQPSYVDTCKNQLSSNTLHLASNSVRSSIFSCRGAPSEMPLAVLQGLHIPSYSRPPHTLLTAHCTPMFSCTNFPPTQILKTPYKAVQQAGQCVYSPKRVKHYCKVTPAPGRRADNQIHSFHCTPGVAWT